MKLRADSTDRLEKIIRCPNCGTLLIDNPKRRSAGMLISISGLILWGLLSAWMGTSMLLLVSIIAVSFLISLLIRNFSAVKKDLVIRNILTRQISYIDKSDWEEIVRNNGDKDNMFEIIEEL